VAASSVVHGLVFLGLPVITNSAESKKLPDRIVGVVELTPDQQAKLPPSMMVSQFPVNPSMPLLPTTLGGKVPLTGLFPGMPDPGIPLTPTKNSINTLMDDIARDTAIANSNNNSSYSYTSPSYTPYVPPIKTTPTQTEAEKKAEEETKKKDFDLAVQKEIEVRREAQLKAEADKLKAEEAKKNSPPGTSVIVAAGQQPTTPPGSTPNPPGGPTPGAADLKTPTPAQVAQQQQLIAATTYVAKGTTVPEQDAAQQALPGALLAQLEPELNKLSEADRQAIVGKIAFSAVPTAPIELREFQPQVASLPPGVDAFNFGNAKPPEQVEAIIQVYLTPDGKLLGKPAIVRSAGPSWLNDLAIQAVEKALTEKPEKLDYKAIRFKVPYVLPKKANA
jgi:hypothetical protein